MTCCSQSGPTNPDKILDFFVEYYWTSVKSNYEASKKLLTIVREASARISRNFNKDIYHDTTAGFPGG